MTAAQRKPVALHLYDKKSHKTEEELKALEDAEVSMGTVDFTAPAEVKKNKNALAKWKEITKIYKDSGLQLVTSTDNGVLGRYCMMYADYIDLMEHRKLLSAASLNPKLIANIKAVSKKVKMGTELANKVLGVVSYCLSLDGLTKMDDKINRKADAILKLEDRIFLNPAAKVRTLPISRKSEKKKDIGDLGFDV